MSPVPTASQTVGPYFAFGLCERPAHEVVAPDAAEAVRVTGSVLDGAGVPIPDAMVETWDGEGGWGRCGTDADGRFALVVAKPAPRGAQAPHLSVLVFARGLLKPVRTRLYFPDEEANGADPLLAALDPAERERLVAAPTPDGLRFDVRLQGPDQTPFFAV